MNSIMIIAIIGFYLISCIGFYKTLMEHPEVFATSATVPVVVASLTIALFSLFWPIVVFTSLFFKGIMQ